VSRLRGKLGGADRGKIDQYLEAIRDVERRMQLADSRAAATCRRSKARPARLKSSLSTSS